MGLFNLFPIPALDGWRFFLLLGEGVFRKKLPAKWEYAINAAGLAILLGVMVLVTFSDVTKLFLIFAKRRFFCSEGKSMKI
ncbi:MAG: site-2 protease family protein [Anaerotruncus sp.]|nr:MAG: site-2 protease family protein [Anaerotruncus sp.]